MVVIARLKHILGCYCPDFNIIFFCNFIKPVQVFYVFLRIFHYQNNSGVFPCA